MTNVNVRLIVDNYCLVCSGNGRSVDKIWNPLGWKPKPYLSEINVTLISLSDFSFVYLIAWSDANGQKWTEEASEYQKDNRQGLLAEVTFPPKTSSGDDSWMVLPTGSALGTGMSPSLAKINEVLKTKPWTDWRPPFKSTVPSVAPPASKDFPKSPTPPRSTPLHGSWIWNKTSGGIDKKENFAPFWPAYDHDEFLIFRVPPPTPTKPIDLELPFKLELPKREGDSLESSLVDPKLLPKLDDLAAYIAAARPSCVTIEGYTSSEGSDNVALSQRRANCVAAWLAEKSKLPTDSFEPKGIVSKQSKYQPSTNPKNRRVEFIFSW